MSEWKEYRLGEVCVKIGSGATPKGGKEAYLGGDISLIRSQNVLDFTFSKEGLAYINGEQADKLMNVEVKENDVLLNITGDSVARACIVPQFVLPARVNQHVAIIRGDESLVLNKFILYLLQYKKRHLLSISQGGATRNALTKKMIEDFEISLPSLPTQQKIASILSSLDDKIEVNRRINEQLEELAQALFKSWFVDFEPFKDGDFVESELGMIPKGWKVCRLDEVSKLIAGGDKPNIVSSNRTDDTPYPIYSNGIDNYGLYGYSDNFRIKEESVTVSARGTIGYVCLREEPYTPIVRLISIIPNTDSVSAKFIYHSLKIKPIQGTGTTQQQLTVPMFRNTLLVVPPQEVMGSFTLKVDSLFALRRKNQQEIRHLTTLRDTLLPKLMSGEIGVNDVAL